MSTLKKTRNFRSILLLNCFLLLCNWCWGQRYTNNDSLLKVYNSSAHDSIRIRAILALGWKLWESDPERSNAYAKKGLETALTLNDKLWIGESYRLLGMNYFQKDDFVNAAKYYLLALEQQEKAGNKMAMARVYTNLGGLYEEQSMFTEALRAYEKALKLKEGKEELWRHEELSNMGMIYNSLQNYPKAEEYLKEALRIENKYGLVRSVAQSLQSLGNIAMNKGNAGKADSLYKRAVVILDSLGDEASVRVCLLTISVMYYQMGKYAEAAIYSHKARSMIKGQPSLSNLEIIYTVFSDYERSKGNFKTALLYSDSVIQVKEKLYSTELASQTAGLLEKYNTEKAEKENMLLKKENEVIEALANKRKMFLWVSVIALVFIICSIALYIRQNKLKTLQKSIELKHQVLRSQINPHFIFNALNAIQKLYLENKTQLADEYLGDFGHLLRKILDNSSKTYVSLHEEMETLQLYLSLEKNRTEDAFEFEIILQDELDTLHMSVPSLLFQPIVENAIWHGLAPKGKGKITVSIKKLNSKMLEAIIQDDGVGISGDKGDKLYSSKGMELVEERLKPGGSLSVSSDSGKGTSVTMLIPYKFI